MTVYGPSGKVNFKQTADLCAGKDCSGHGQCNANTGACDCEAGWAGLSC